MVADALADKPHCNKKCQLVCRKYLNSLTTVRMRKEKGIYFEKENIWTPGLRCRYKHVQFYPRGETEHFGEQHLWFDGSDSWAVKRAWFTNGSEAMVGD